MHEMGLCDAIVEAVLEKAHGRTVRSARVRVGGHPVDAGVIDQGFRLAAAGTAAEGAAVELAVDPLTVQCRDCGSEAPATDALAMVACRRCGGVDVEVRGGDHLAVESITFAEPDQERI